VTVTFKKHPKDTGLAAIAHPYSSVDIKIDKKRVGYIGAPNAFSDDYWDIHFSVLKSDTDKPENCPWKWIRLKQKFATEEEARVYVKEHENAITKLPLYPLTD
jgi:hypothetical protein